MGVRAIESAELSNDFSGCNIERLNTSTTYKISADPAKYAGNKGKLISYSMSLWSIFEQDRNVNL